MRITLPVGTLRDALLPAAELINEAILVDRGNEIVVTARTPCQSASIIVTITMGDDGTELPKEENIIGVSLKNIASFVKTLPETGAVTRPCLIT